jgi:hypothetical protein
MTKTARKTRKRTRRRRGRKRAAGSQLELPMRTRGGKRKGAGRKPSGKFGRGAGVPHRRRGEHKRNWPVHISITVLPDLPSLRGRRCIKAIERAFWGACHRGRPDFRPVHFSVQKRHVHLIVEAECGLALSRGMQGLCIRIARALNKALRRRGKVFSDRFFSRAMSKPAETRNSLVYVLNNARRHDAQRGKVRDRWWIDPCSSGRYFDGWVDCPARPPPDEAEWVVARPRCWLLRQGWRKFGGGAIRVDEVPGRRGLQRAAKGSTGPGAFRPSSPDAIVLQHHEL